jgi:hypothetical protein
MHAFADQPAARVDSLMPRRPGSSVNKISDLTATTGPGESTPTIPTEPKVFRGVPKESRAMRPLSQERQICWQPMAHPYDKSVDTVPQHRSSQVPVPERDVDITEETFQHMKSEKDRLNNEVEVRKREEMKAKITTKKKAGKGAETEAEEGLLALSGSYATPNQVDTTHGLIPNDSTVQDRQPLGSSPLSARSDKAPEPARSYPFAVTTQNPFTPSKPNPFAMVKSNPFATLTPDSLTAIGRPVTPVGSRDHESQPVSILHLSNEFVDD